MLSHDFVDELNNRFLNASNAERAQEMAAYMRHKFVFFGIPAPHRRQIQRETIHVCGFPSDVLATTTKLYSQPQREFHVCAVDILLACTTKVSLQHLLPPTDKSLHHIEHLIRSNSWWDTVDFLASHVVARILREKGQKARKRILNEWIKDSDLWIRRSAILAQLHEGRNTDVLLLFSLVLQTADEAEFFIRKASGWALRECAKTYPNEVLAFVEGNVERLSALTKKEALRNIRS